MKQRWWNLHHLALFYHVARHGGISAALPHIGYSIQQPALSEQMLQLEAQLEQKLFTRQPFALTPAGAQLFRAIEGPFAGMLTALDALGAASTSTLRVGAPAFVLARYLPRIALHCTRRLPGLRFDFCSADSQVLLERVRAGELDIAIALTNGHTHGVARRTLLSLPLALVVPQQEEAPVARQLLGRGRLVCPMADATLSQALDAGLKRHRITWTPSVRVDSVALVPHFVASGHGTGLGLHFAPLIENLPVASLPLHDFKPVQIIAAWRNPGSHAIEEFVAEVVGDDALPRKANV